VRSDSFLKILWELVRGAARDQLVGHRAILSKNSEPGDKKIGVLSSSSILICIVIILSMNKPIVGVLAAIAILGTGYFVLNDISSQAEQAAVRTAIKPDPALIKQYETRMAKRAALRAMMKPAQTTTTTR
jgi:hypothetical protein